MRLLTAVFLALTLIPISRAQCVSHESAERLLGDHFIDTVEIGNHLILATAFGIQAREINALNDGPLWSLAIPGEITGLKVQGRRLWVAAKGNGLYAYDYEPGGNAPEMTFFLKAVDIEEVAVNDDFIAVDQGNRISLFTAGDQQATLLDERFYQSERLTAVGNNFVFMDPQGNLRAISYNRNGFGPENEQLFPEETSARFYDISALRDLLIIDAYNGIRWARLDNAAQVVDSGFFFQNQGSEIVLDTATAGNFLYLRFAERLDLYLINLSGNAVRTDSLDQPFEAIAYTRLDPTPQHLHVLNLGSQRTWSIESRAVTSERFQAPTRVAAGYAPFTGTAVIDNNLYFSESDTVYEGGYLDAELTELEPRPILQVNGDITAMTSFGTQLVVFYKEPESAQSRFQLYRINEQGLAVLSSSRTILGSVIQAEATEFGSFFIQTYRNAVGDHYIINVMVDNNNGGFLTRTVERVMPLDDPNPFIDVQLTDIGLTYRADNTIYRHANLQSNSLETTLLPESSAVKKVVYADGTFWVESANGLSTYSKNGTTYTLETAYPHWFDLQRTGRTAIARNRLDNKPARYFILQMGENHRYLKAEAGFQIAEPPAFMCTGPEKIFAIGNGGFQTFDLGCPNQDYVYMVPFTDDLELDLLTNLDQDESVTITIFNAANEIIGKQRLEVNEIGIRNGSVTDGWVYDYNALETPHGFIIQSSAPLSPIVSGTPRGQVNGRFATEIMDHGSSQLFVPHIPRNLDYWNTSLVLRNMDNRPNAKVNIRSASGEILETAIDPGGTDVIPILSASFERATPWAGVSSDNLAGAMTGFTLIQEDNLDRAAAVPLVRELSDFLVVPRINGRYDSSAWTGLVLANPHDEDVVVRLIGFGPDGDVDQDQLVVLKASTSLVVVVEEWLGKLKTNKAVHWMAAASAKPIMGMVLFGNLFNNQLSGLPLNPETGTRLDFAGIRSGSDWWTKLYVTNLKSVPDQIIFTAYDAQGNVLGTTVEILGIKANAEFQIAQLFSRANFNTDLIKSVTATTQQQTEITGFVMRGKVSTDSLESYCALARD